MSEQHRGKDRGIGHGLRLRTPPHWQVQTDAQRTVATDPDTGLKLQVFIKPCRKGGVALSRLADLGLEHLTKTLPGGAPMGDWQAVEGQGWQGRTLMMSYARPGREAVRVLYTVFIIDDESDPNLQNNVSALLEVQGDVFERLPAYFENLVPSGLAAGAEGSSIALVDEDVAVTPRQAPPPPEPQAPSHDTDDGEAELLLAARGQKLVVYAILLNFLFRAVERSMDLPGPLLLMLGLVVTGLTVNGVVKICSSLGVGQGGKLALMVVAVFPLINLIVLVALSMKATRLLRDGGWEVGLLGAKP